MAAEPGVSGNPGGRPKGLREFREALEAADVPQLMFQVLCRGLVHESMEIALAAYDRAAAYLYGRAGTLDVPPVSVLGSGERISASRVEEAQRLLTADERSALL